MATEFLLTPSPVRAVGTGKQALKDALDVSAFDQGDVLLLVSGLEGTTPSVTVKIITGMQMETEDGWVTAVTFTAVTVAPGAQKLNVPGLLKYIRWEVSAFAGTAAIFTVSGMLRQN